MHYKLCNEGTTEPQELRHYVTRTGNTKPAQHCGLIRLRINTKFRELDTFPSYVTMPKQ